MGHFISKPCEGSGCLVVAFGAVELMKCFFVEVDFFDVRVLIEPFPEGFSFEVLEFKSVSK